MLPMMILTGGLGTRLRPVTNSKPKALYSVCGEPFIAHQLRLLRRSGIEHVVLCVGYLGEQICNYVQDGAMFDMRVEYSWDGPVLLGTAGAIRQALSKVGTSFFVLYGDSYLPCNYRDVERKYLNAGKHALMTVVRNDGTFGESNVTFVNGQIKRYDKKRCVATMEHVDYGLSVFQRSVFQGVSRGTQDLSSVYSKLIEEKQLAAYEMRERFYEAGSHSGIQDLSKLLLEQERRTYGNV